MSFITYIGIDLGNVEEWAMADQSIAKKCYALVNDKKKMFQTNSAACSRVELSHSFWKTWRPCLVVCNKSTLAAPPKLFHTSTLLANLLT